MRIRRVGGMLNFAGLILRRALTSGWALYIERKLAAVEPERLLFRDVLDHREIAIHPRWYISPVRSSTVRERFGDPRYRIIVKILAVRGVSRVKRADIDAPATKGASHSWAYLVLHNISRGERGKMGKWGKTGRRAKLSNHFWMPHFPLSIHSDVHSHFAPLAHKIIG